MKKILIPVLFLFVFAIGCSGGGSPITPQQPADEPQGRIGLSTPYIEGDFEFVDVVLEGVPAICEFMLKLEFDPKCIEPDEFEPSSVFGSAPAMRCEKVVQVPDDVKVRMKSPQNGLTEIEVSITVGLQGDIISPDYIGRIKFKTICEKGNDSPFGFIKDPNFLVFRNRNQEKWRVDPIDNKVPPCNHDFKGGDNNGDKGSGNKDDEGGCKDKCKKENCDCGCHNGEKCDCEKCDCGCHDGGGCGKDNCGGKCDKENCDCGCHEGEKCDCKDCGCGCHKDGGCGNGGNCGDGEKCKCGCDFDKEGCECGCHEGEECDCKDCGCKCHDEGCENGGGCGGGENGGGCGNGGDNGGGCGGGDNGGGDDGGCGGGGNGGGGNGGGGGGNGGCGSGGGGNGGGCGGGGHRP